MTTDKLLDFLRRLDRKVTIRITRREPGEPYQEIGFGQPEEAVPNYLG